MDRDDMNWLRDQLMTLHDKVDDIKIVQVKNTADLAEHMRRTDLLEKEIKPVKAHVTFVNMAAKVIVTLGTLAGVARSIGLL